MITKQLLKFTGFLFFALLVLSACRTKGDTIATIKVINQNNQVLTNAHVSLTSAGDQGPGAWSKEGTTNSSGEVSFNFNEQFKLGSAGLAIMDVHVEKDGEEAYGVIKIEPEKHSKKTITLGV